MGCQSRRAAVAGCIRKLTRRSLNPLPRARELGDWHQFDGGDAQIPQLRNARDNRVKRPLARECAHVKFVEDVVAQFNPTPVFILPFEAWRYNLRRSMNSLRLEPRSWIGKFEGAVR